MLEFMLTGLLGMLLIALACLVLYETLRALWNWLPRMQWHPRLRIGVMVMGIFSAHILNIWLFGLVYYALLIMGVGTLSGGAAESGLYELDLIGCLYYSAVIYSTLGLGDITPEGALRMITGVEGLTGFILIGWTASFTYLAMEKFWQIPHRRKK